MSGRILKLASLGVVALAASIGGTAKAQYNPWLRQDIRQEPATSGGSNGINTGFRAT